MVVAGPVVRGKGEGKRLGYPTANVLHEARGLASGVFLCQAQVGDTIHHGLAVVGMWTQENGLPSLEAHILDFSEDIYGQRITVMIGQKLRDLIDYSHVGGQNVGVENFQPLLVAQIKKDVEDARAYVHRHRP